MTLLKADRSALLVIDYQERLLPAINGGDMTLANGLRLIDGAKRLGLPVLASEQYPKGIGASVEPVRARLEARDIYEKMTFSAAADAAFRARVASLGAKQLVICGIEAHVCVLQTALDFKAAGFDVYVVADAVGSRTEANKERALARMAGDGVRPVTVEMVLFEWLGQAGTPAFKDVMRLIK